MKCSGCGKEINTAKKEEYPPPKWFGYYVYAGLKSLICAECITDPEKKEQWIQSSKE